MTSILMQTNWHRQRNPWGPPRIRLTGHGGLCNTSLVKVSIGMRVFSDRIKMWIQPQIEAKIDNEHDFFSSFCQIHLAIN